MAHNNNTASELIIIKPTTTKLAEDDGFRPLLERNLRSKTASQTGPSLHTFKKRV